MPDPTLSEALEEAYASAPSDAALIHTLSMWYEGLEVEGAPSEIYTFQGFSGDRSSAEGVPLKDFRLEATARHFGGEVVEFVGIPFSVTMPQVTTTQIVKGQLIFDGVGREIADALRSAIGLGQPVEMTYRAYLEGMEDDGPQNDPPLVFALHNVSINATTVQADISTVNAGGRRFPGKAYRPDEFPAIR